MTVTYGFFNSVSGDRAYNAVQLSSIFDGVIRDGVFGSIGTALMVTPSSGLNISVGIGRAWFNHTWTFNDAAILLGLDLPDMVFPRIDAVVLEVNSEDSVRANTIKIVKGTPTSSPTAPSMTNSSTVHQYPLAYISVPVGVSTITSGHITNKVGSSECPFVTGPLSIISTDSLISQWQIQFTTWFDHMKGQLDTDAAGHLQNEVDGLAAVDAGLQSQITSVNADAHTIDNADIVNYAVSYSKLASNASKVIARQGGSANDWSVAGLTNYTPAGVAIQTGVFTLTNDLTHLANVTFPIAFLATPVVVAIVSYCASNSAGVNIQTITASGVVFAPFEVYSQVFIDSESGLHYVMGAAPVGTIINWMAIGPVA
jgi:hypothetical protein